MGSAGKKLRTRMDIGKDIQSCLDDLNNMTHAKLAELLNLSEKTVDRMVAGKGPITKQNVAEGVNGIHTDTFIVLQTMYQ